LGRNNRNLGEKIKIEDAKQLEFLSTVRIIIKTGYVYLTISSSRTQKLGGFLKFKENWHFWK